MKKSISYLIFILLWLPSAYAQMKPPVTDTQAEWNKAKANYEKWQKEHPGVNAFRESERLFGDVAPCIHCPAPLALISSMMPILKAMPNAPSDPIVGELQLQYAIEKTNFDNQIRCRTFMQDPSEMINPKKYNGQFIQLAEGVFNKYSSIVEIAYRADHLDEMIYYYRDKGNHIVQVILDKNGKAMFRYFEYIPTAQELNPYNLPELSTNAPDSKRKSQFDENATPQTPPTLPKKEEGFFSVDGSAKYVGELKYANRVTEKLYIPNNFEVAKANGKVKIGEVHVLGDLQSSTKGHEVQVGVLSSGGNKVAILTAETNIAGKNPKETITFPYSVEVDSIGVGVTGHVATSITENGKQDTMVIRLLEPFSSSGNRKDYVTLTAIKDDGKDLIYNLQKNYVTTSGSVFTAAAGRDANGNYVGGTYVPAKNINNESITFKAQTNNGVSGLYIVYSRILK